MLAAPPAACRLVLLIGDDAGLITERAQALVQMLCDGRPSDDLIGVAQFYLDRHAPQDDAMTAAPAP